MRCMVFLQVRSVHGSPEQARSLTPTSMNSTSAQWRGYLTGESAGSLTLPRTNPRSCSPCFACGQCLPRSCGNSNPTPLPLRQPQCLYLCAALLESQTLYITIVRNFQQHSKKLSAHSNGLHAEPTFNRCAQCAAHHRWLSFPLFQFVVVCTTKSTVSDRQL